MHHVLFALICLIWGTSFMFMKVGLVVYGPVTVGAWRVGWAALVIALVWLCQRRPWPFSRADVVHLVGISLLGVAFPYVAQPYIIKVIERHTENGSSFAGMMVALVPLSTIVASVFMLRVFPTVRQAVGVLVGFTAFGVLLRYEFEEGVRLSDLMLASITPMLYAFTNTWIKRRFGSYPTTPVLLMTMSVSLPILLVVMSLVGPMAEVTAQPAVVVPGVEPLPAALGAMFVLGVVCTAAAVFMFYKLVQTRGPLFAGMVTYIIPCLAMLVGLATGETISKTQWGALAVILCMVALVQTGHRPVPQTTNERLADEAQLSQPE